MSIYLSSSTCCCSTNRLWLCSTTNVQACCEYSRDLKFLTRISLSLTDVAESGFVLVKKGLIELVWKGQPGRCSMNIIRF